MYPSHRLLALALLTPVLLTGCSSSNNDPAADTNAGAGDGSDPGSTAGGEEDREDDDGDGDEPSDGLETLLFFQGSLKAIDPRSPSAISVISEDDITVVSSLLAADFVATGGPNGAPRLRGFETLEQIYVDGNEIKRVKAQVRAGEAPEDTDLVEFPQEVTSLFNASDFADPSRTQLIAELADGTFQTVLLNGETRPFPAEPLEQILDYSDGRHLGFLVIEDDDLLFVDTAGEQSKLGEFEEIDHMADSGSNGSFFDCDGSVHFLDHAALTLTDLEIDLEAFDDFEAESDGQNMLLMSSIGKTISIDRVDRSGNSSPVFQTSDGFENQLFPGNQELELALAGDRIVFSYTADSIQFPGAADGNRLRSVKEDGSDPILLAETAGPSLLIARDAIFFSEFAANGTTLVALSTTGTELFREAQTFLSGFVFGDLSFGAPVVETVVFVRGIEFTIGFPGASVVALNTADFTQVDLGALPSDADVFIIAPSFDDELLGQAIINGPTFNQDIFFLDTDTAGSLTRVTDTPEVESVVLDATSIGG